jgi:large repetitive protein
VAKSLTVTLCNFSNTWRDFGGRAGRRAPGWLQRRRGRALRAAARRAMSRATAVLLVLSAVAVPLTVAAPDAQAAGTVLFDQPSHDKTVDGPAGSVTVPTAPAGTNSACLTASGNSSTGPLLTCSSSKDNNGSGKLRTVSSNAAGSTCPPGSASPDCRVTVAAGGDLVSNDYQIVIPDVRSATYSGTLTYIATATP